MEWYLGTIPNYIMINHITKGVQLNHCRLTTKTFNNAVLLLMVARYHSTLQRIVLENKIAQ